MPASFDPGFDQSMERLVRACDELARVQAIKVPVRNFGVYMVGHPSRVLSD